MDRIKRWDGPISEVPRRFSSQPRMAAAWVLRAASVALDRLAHQMAAADDRSPGPGHARIEFHAESGAPEGALYIDGKLVGRIDGVRRL